MTRQLLWGALGLAVLAACSPRIPDSGAAAQAGPKPAPQVATGTEATATSPAAASPAAPATAAPATISDEQDFQAVSSRETIESDADRLAANRARYVLVEPSELPARPGGDQALVVEYALATNNPVGVQLYKRSALSGEARAARNCARYARVDQAQAAFLARGGPKRDPLGLDPDGDGFACNWDPTPYRLARQGGENLETAGPVSIDITH